MQSKIKLIISSLVVIASACGPNSKNVKVYYLEPAQGLVRKQTQEVLPFEKARGYLCENPADFQETVSCLQAQVKVYYLDPPVGLVRKQSGEVRPFSMSRGFLCTSPDDFRLILEDCKSKEISHEAAN